jgi:hypothetical protein
MFEPFELPVPEAPDFRWRPTATRKLYLLLSNPRRLLSNNAHDSFKHLKFFFVIFIIAEGGFLLFSEQTGKRSLVLTQLIGMGWIC